MRTKIHAASDGAIFLRMMRGDVVADDDAPQAVLKKLERKHKKKGVYENNLE